MNPDRCAAFRALHVPGRAFIMPNPWDVGSTRILAAAGFEALASSSAALGFTLGLADAAGAIGRAAS
ncbi:MAG: isocitrate lyase/phosphoenolpyruvate mutase family protein, partial [Methylobacteriaceae bacterium]|nr:isocitrate lyase/phosphoenolpyruvate mutase family protein [Methylobacteriaceae bacterium]